MKLEQQTTSLEISKRLKELGVKQESLFIWDNFAEDDWRLKHHAFYGSSVDYSSVTGGSLTGDKVSAFTVAELGEMLPEEIEVKEQSCWFTVCKNDVWTACYRKNGTNEFWFIHTHENEADARGKMLVYLLENKLITL